MKSIKQAKIKNKRVLVRLDFNNQWRVRASLPTLDYLLKEGADRVIVVGHRGRPDGEPKDKFSLAPFKKYLPKGVILLENLRFDPREENNTSSLARELADKADLFVQEAFSVCHRRHASIVGVPNLLSSFAGLRLQEEVEQLSADFEKPIIYLIGGIKVTTKLSLVQELLAGDKLDHLLLGGVVANEVLLNKEVEITDRRVHLPVDAVTQRGISAVGEMGGGGHILDIGPDTRALFKQVVRTAQTIVWNGPLGKFEESRFAWGTRDLSQSVAQSKAKTIIGGGETIEAAQKFTDLEKFNFVSTGGGAMLQFLAKGALPGLEALG